MVIVISVVEAEWPERVHVAWTSYWIPVNQLTVVQFASTATPDPLAVNAGEVLTCVYPCLFRFTTQDAPGRV
jgi:hypothetical protein